MWNRRLKLGTYFKIDVFLHWSFALLVLYVAWASWSDGLVGMAFSLCLLLAMFVCVTLHEYGHALVARRFGIETIDITLLPIGGVARLVRIPRIPIQELLVAVAGPAVNVVIVILLLGVLLAVPPLGFPSLGELIGDADAVGRILNAFDQPTFLGFLLSLIVINTALVLFNFLPAFPMDGGRVLRSVLAMALEYRQATRIAAVIGVGCAAMMGSAALYFGAPTAGLVAVFICYAGLAEARQVSLLEPLRRLSVGNVMIHQPPFLCENETLDEFVSQMHRCPTAATPVIDLHGRVVGILTLSGVSQAVRDSTETVMEVRDVTDFDVPILSPHQPLEDVVTQGHDGRRQFPVADANGTLVGLLDLDTLHSRIQVARRMQAV
ncbi:MAG: site-2 protease family protein [Planctomycetota bacterium]